ncbi:cytochrome P450 [Microseira wollei]|uniref:Cytochrome P450 n=1 Tax=Microseira wollei NIES-4236 TaxID=2530354 RepID=A0AAV3XKB6_9CYAN|nr:cytochrome P450 [Microseira wollei]GET39927.1 cytochrome P450 [Microseira wollei NIES-4236]
MRGFLTRQDGETRDVNADMRRLTLANIVMKTIFNSDITDKAAQDSAQVFNQGMDWYEQELRKETKVIEKIVGLATREQGRNRVYGNALA